MDAGIGTTRIGLALVQAVIAWEFLSSGVTKLVHGDFPGGLAATLHERLGAAPGWYADFLRDTVIPHAVAFGWAIELGEVAVALLLLAGAAGALTGRRRAAAAATALGAFAGFVLALAFGLSDGAGFFVLVAPDSFDEGVSLDALAAWLQVVLLASALAELVDEPAIRFGWLRGIRSTLGRCTSSPLRVLSAVRAR
ncbi:MAG TPA: hypothetical protein VFJ91_08625 [Gaiellaceae bacterium]|nr:hypothetical protein [Gaiellaceae bacterium]